MLNKISEKINFKKYKYLFLGIFLIVLLVLFIGNKDSNEGVSKYQVSPGEVVEYLILNGEVDPVFGAEMAFSTSGTVDRVYKNAGDPVFLGEKIAELDNDSLRADLSDAIANLELKRAEAKVSTAELDRAVESAYIELLNNDLRAYPKDGEEDYDVSVPVVSGSYIGNKEGQYTIEVYGSNAESGTSFRYYGLENQDTGTVNQYSLSRLGNLGLYLQFDDSNYKNTDWIIPIPNTRSSTYATLLNRYKETLASRDASQSSNISTEIANAKIKQAEAGVAKIQAGINERTIRAPFDGVVSKVSIKQGEIAEAGKIVTGVISDGSYEVVVEVPEIDIVNLATGLSTDITLDAYGDDIIFKGLLVSIDPAETEVDGVSVYRAKVSFTEPDARVRSGMTARVSIIKNKKEGVLRLPARFIDTDETGEFVLIENLVEEENDKVYIVTGLKGSDGFVEVISGAKEGDVVIGEFKE